MLGFQREPLGVNSWKSALLLIMTYKSAFDPDKKGDPAPPSSCGEHAVPLFTSTQCPKFPLRLAFSSD